MKTSPNSGAFPRPDSPEMDAAPGLTKLEYFAAAALSGVLAGDTEGNLSQEKAARFAVKQARALIAELNAEGEK